MEASRRWPDERLDELNRRLINVESTTTAVAVMKSEMVEVRGSLKEANAGIRDLSQKVTNLADEPLVRARDFRKQMLQGIIAALAGGGFVFLATLLASAVH